MAKRVDSMNQGLCCWWVAFFAKVWLAVGEGKFGEGIEDGGEREAIDDPDGGLN